MTKAPQPGDLIAHHRVIRPSVPGVGEVYLARDTTLDRDVALKGFVFEFGASTDGKTVYFIQGALNRDIVMIRGLK